MKKLPAINFAEKVKFVPYAFEDENGKSKRGVSVYQDGVKLTDYFYDGDTQSKLHGFPVIDKKDDETWSKDEWKMYFMKARIFLVKYIKENIVPKFDVSDVPTENKEAVDYPENEVKPEDIPF